MSGVNNKLNGNLIISGSSSASKNNSNSNSSGNNNNSVVNNQQHSSKGQHSVDAKLQHSHQHPQLAQQQSVTGATSSSNNFTSNNSVQPTGISSQLQTVATIHHHHHNQQQQQQIQQQVTQHQLPTATTSATNQRHSLHHLHSVKSSETLHCTTVLPRYQPPPQLSGGGILKHLSTVPLSERHINKSSSAAYFAELSSTSPHLNIKYPPDIPQLSSVYIPDSIKAQANPSRFIQHQHQQQQLQHHHHQQQRHHRSGGGTASHLILSNQQQQQQEQQQQEMLKFVRKSDQDQSSPNTPVTTPTGIQPSSGRLTAEQNRQLQSLITELRVLKEANQRLIDDNQELRDLCCFLDDDRQKGRKLAREWQRFGRYTASVMRQEVSAYQNKLRQLDDKQQELITDNLELKELCLYLDEERAHVAANTLCVNCGAPARPTLRDDGDGSSSSTNADETMSAIRNYERQLPDHHLRTTLSDQTLQYVRSLERRIHQLEEERLAAASTPTANVISASSQATPTPELISGRPEAVVRALQVLEVREQLERDRLGNLTGTPIEQMDDGEKALVREMCNVVWRKLEGSPNDPNGMEPL